MVVSKGELFVLELKFLLITLKNGFLAEHLILMMGLLQIGGCIFVYHAYGFLHVEHQVGLSAVKTVRNKQNYESMCMEHECCPKLFD